MEDKNNVSNPWLSYYEATEAKPTSTLLVEALGYVEDKEKALDLGAGALRDTKFLIDEGFKTVIALDKSPEVAEKVRELGNSRIKSVTSSFDEYDFPKAEFDLINAQFSLPFNQRETFEKVMERLKASLRAQGVFTGQLFGERDEWNTGRRMTFLTEQQARVLFKDMEVVKFEEEEGDNRATASGIPKHWHIFHIIAKKH
jgi:tellurite methyltransferase